MSSKFLPLFCLLTGLGFATVQAATTTVTPGTGTLKTAVDAAADGDILLLQTGDYNLNAHISVARGLTLRPVDATQLPRVVLNGKNITLTNTTAPTTLQALEFVGTGTINTSNTKELNILENMFTDVHLTFNSITRPCYIIGNTTQRSSLAYNVYLDPDCYVAGNTFEGADYFTANSGYFIGNKVSLTTNRANGVNLYAAYAIGNEFIRNQDPPSPGLGNANYNVVVVQKPQQTGLTNNWPLIANNIVRVIGSPGSAPTAPGIKSMAAIYLMTNSQLHNNVVDFGQFEWSTQGQQAMIYVRHNSTIQSNIVVNGSNNDMKALDFYNDTERNESDFSFNLCYNDDANCGLTDGNLDVEPDFDSFVDYTLSTESPAEDAGSVNEHLADLDGSRNDMGVHGGPHPFGQYKAQIGSGVTAPFVYPVFEETQTLTGAQIDVSAIGVARFK